jgi:hypothetical protein
MAAKILLGDEKKGAGALAPAPDSAWYLLGGAGFLFAVVAGVDLVLAWYPARFGNAEWEFGSVTTTLNNLPVFTTAVLFVLGAAVARGTAKQIRVVGSLLGVLALLVAVCGFLYFRNVSVALASVTDPLALMGLKKAITKTSGQIVLYPIGFGWLAFRSLRHAATR